MLSIGVRAKVIVVTSGVFLLGMAAVVGTNHWLFVGEHARALQSRSTAVATSLKVQLERLLQFDLAVRDLVGFEELCDEAVESYEGVSFALVASPDGDILFHTHREDMGKRVLDPDLKKALSAVSPLRVSHLEDGIPMVSAVVPVFSPAGQHVAAVVIGVTKETLSASGRKMAIVGAGISLVILLAGTGILIIALSVTVTQPLGRLMGSVKAFGRSPTEAGPAEVGGNDEIGRLAATFNDMARRLELVLEQEREARQAAEAANRTKSNFLANVSHELRTPLNAIIGFSEMIVTEVFGPVGSPRYNEYLKDIHGSASHLLNLINDILDMAKVEAGRLELYEEEVCPRAAADAVLRLVKDRATASGVSLKVDFPDALPAVRADELRLKQILLNLLTNAVKFTPPGGTVMLACRYAPDSGLAFTVSDTGVGMDEGELAEAMRPFGQADSGLNRRHEGTGLGLPLTVALVAMHGGELRLDSRKGRGTCATVKLGPERVTGPRLSAPALS